MAASSRAGKLPTPLTPPDCDLRALDWFPFYHKRLLTSSFWSRASDRAARISVDFWSKAYQLVPAASLPDDDYLLAEWAGFGRRGIEGWSAIKHEVMSPWLLCFDGRWYHPVLSEVACQAWLRRRHFLWRREVDRLRKENLKRREKKLDPLELPKKPPDDPFFDADGVFVFDGMAQLSGGNSELSNGNAVDAQLSAGKPAISGGTPAEKPQQSPEYALTGTGTHPTDDSPSQLVRSRGVARTGAHARTRGGSPDDADGHDDVGAVH